MDKKSFIVYANDIDEILDELSDEQVAKLFRAMVKYQLTGKDPGFTGILKVVWIQVRQGMDRNDDRYEKRIERNRENGRKGGAPKGNQNAKKTTETTETTETTDRLFKTTETTETSLRERERERDRDREREPERESEPQSRKRDASSLSLSVISHLNEAAGTNYDPEDSVLLIGNLARKGYTEEQMIEVIDKKCAEWLGDPVVEGYLRPSTLFGKKFAEYVNEPGSAKLEKQKKARHDAERDAENARRVREEGEAYNKRLKEEFDRQLRENEKGGG